MVSELRRDGGDPKHLVKKLDSWLKPKGINEISIKSKNNDCLFDCLYLAHLYTTKMARLQVGRDRHRTETRPHIQSLCTVR
jgi:hypothetical protein